MKVAERTCGNCAWFKPRPEEANHDVPAGLCQFEPLAVDKSAADRCSHHVTVVETNFHYERWDKGIVVCAPRNDEVTAQTLEAILPTKDVPPGPDAA